MSDINEIVSTFSGKDIRVIECDSELWMPIVDIAGAIGYGNDQLTRLVRNNSELFEGFNRTTSTVARQDKPPVTLSCVNEQGLYMLLSKISLNQVQDPAVRQNIITFNRWMVSEIKRIREERSVKLTPMQTPGEVLKDEMSIAMMIQEYLGLDKTLLMVTAITRTEKQTGTSLVEYKNLLPPVVGPVAILTATEVGKQVDMQASKVNLKLAELGLHEKKGGIWTLTEAGKEYGAPFYENVNHGSGSTWQGVINKWSPKVIELIKDNA
jgi:prophage antirepressor-like protein